MELNACFNGTIMMADNNVSCGRKKEKVETKIESSRDAFERREMKVSRKYFNKIIKDGGTKKKYVRRIARIVKTKHFMREAKSRWFGGALREIALEEG